MRTFLIFLLFLFGATGCMTRHSPSHAALILAETAPALVAASDAIDALTADCAETVSVPVTAQTTIIRTIASGLSNSAKALDSATLRAVKAEKLIAELNDAENQRQILLLRWIGVVCVIAAALLMRFGLNLFASLAGAVALCCFGFAQLVSQTWFPVVFDIVIGAIAVAVSVVSVREWQRFLRSKSANELASLHSATLSKVAPFVDVDALPVKIALDDAHKAVLSKLHPKGFTG
jgi:hypothetical protein